MKVLMQPQKKITTHKKVSNISLIRIVAELKRMTIGQL